MSDLEVGLIKEKYEATLCSELSGKKINKVSYFEIDYGNQNFDSGDHHSLDFGLELEINTEENYYMIWDSQYIQHDLKFGRGTILKEFGDPSNVICHDVSRNKFWKRRIGAEIQKIESHWGYAISHREDRRKYYPYGIQIYFENKLEVIISASEVGSDKQVATMSDHVSVFFDFKTAEQYGLIGQKGLM